MKYIDLDGATFMNDEGVYLILMLIGCLVLGYIFGRIIRIGLDAAWPISVPKSQEGEEFLGKRKIL